MASEIVYSSLTLNSDEARDVSQVVFEAAFAKPDVAETHLVQTGVVMDRYIPILSQLGLVGKLDPGSCGVNAVSTIATSNKQWTPKLVSGRITHCRGDIPALLKFWGQSAKANKIWEESDPAEMKFIGERTLSAMHDAILRIADFGDTAAEVVGSGGYLTAGTDKTYFNMLSGLWKQIFTDQALGTPKTARYTISENSEGDKASQLLLADDAAYKAFKGMYEKIDSRAFSAGDLKLQVTRTLWDNWVAYMENKAGAYRPEILEDGMTKESFRGIPIVIRYDWDRIIKTYHDLGDTYYLPHRAILTPIENIPIGTSDSESLSEFLSNYDAYNKVHFIDFAFRLDCKLLEEELLASAW